MVYEKGSRKGEVEYDPYEEKEDREIEYGRKIPEDTMFGEGKQTDMSKEMKKGKQELWTHRCKKGFMWGKPNRQVPKKW